MLADRQGLEGRGIQISGAWPKVKGGSPRGKGQGLVGGVKPLDLVSFGRLGGEWWSISTSQSAMPSYCFGGDLAIPQGCFV